MKTEEQTEQTVERPSILPLSKLLKECGLWPAPRAANHTGTETLQ